MYDPEGDRAAAALISALVGEHLDARGGRADDLSAALAAGCPSYFRDADRTFYAGQAKLRQAAAAASKPERVALGREAAAILCRVPLACPLEATLAALAEVEAYEGAVALAGRYADAEDPAGGAARPELGPECEAARARRAAAYEPLLALLRGLLEPGGGVVEAQRKLPPAERAAHKAAVLAAVSRSPDACLHGAVYGCLLDAGAHGELLAIDSPLLQRYLAGEGGYPPTGAPLPIGIAPLGARAALHLGLLARWYSARRDYRSAAEVHVALATRRSGPGEQGVSLQERQRQFEAAELQARSLGDASYVAQLQAGARACALQRTVAERLRAAADAAPAGPEREAAAAAADAAGEELLEVSELYNAYAHPRRMWDVCLRAVHLAGGAPGPTVRGLWDNLLKDAWEAAAHGAAAAASGDDAAAAQAPLDAACAAAAALAEGFYPDEAALPLPLVALRLEGAAAGLWPHPGLAARPPHPEATVAALLASCRRSAQAVRRVYDVLLAARRGGAAGGLVGEDEAGAPALRAQLLRSLRALCETAAEEAAASGRSDASAEAAEACGRYASEARALGEAELAEAFEALRRRLEAR